ncbi:MAG TPA: signal peptidase I [Solirubrobacteraceae bacterium]|nr:signal peptidase I [Solirubrobacteraceae bacterium]
MTRLAASFAVWCAIGVVVGLVALVTVPRATGVTPLTVLTGSMEPALTPGDVVLSKSLAPLDVRPGDVVSFHDPSRGGELVTHRVESMRRTGSQVRFVTKGDANDVSETWAVAVDGRIGRTAMSVPKVGHVLHWAGSREGKLALIALPAGLLVLLELVGLLGLRRAPAARAAG